MSVTATEAELRPERDVTIDALKGFAILLVVAGHSVYEASSGATTSPLFRGIYSFHMPLFAAISGYLFYRGIERPGWLMNRARGIMIPYFSWILVGFLVGWPASLATPRTLQGLLQRLAAAALGTSPGGGLWYLYTLMTSAAIIWALRRHEWLLVSITAALMLKPYAPSVMFLNELRWVMLPFALSGYLVARHRPISFRWSMALALSYPVLLAMMWPVIETPAWMIALRAAGETVWPEWLPSRLSAQAAINGVFWSGRFLLGAAGVTATVLAWTKVPCRWKRPFAWLGTLSLGIYASHFMWQSACKPLGLSAAPLFATSLAASILTTMAIDAAPALGTLLLGRRSSRARR